MGLPEIPCLRNDHPEALQLSLRIDDFTLEELVLQPWYQMQCIPEDGCELSSLARLRAAMRIGDV